MENEEEFMQTVLGWYERLQNINAAGLIPMPADLRVSCLTGSLQSLQDDMKEELKKHQAFKDAYGTHPDYEE